MKSRLWKIYKRKRTKYHCKRLKPYRTAIERNYGLVKENRYRLEYTNTYMGFSNVHIHVIEHDIALTQDIIYNFQRTGKISSVLKA